MVSLKQVTFEVSVSVNSCPDQEKLRTREFSIYPVGLSERLDIKLNLICECDCEGKGVSDTLKKSLLIDR